MEELKWDKDRLHQLVREKLGDFLFLVVSNREPFIHTISGDEIVCHRPVSGLTEALDPKLFVGDKFGLCQQYIVAQRVLVIHLFQQSIELPGIIGGVRI